MDFLLDTGSAWLWIPTKNCDTCPIPLEAKFNYVNSDTYRETDEEEKIPYLMGSVWGQ